jgi:tRNA nucleotidyltransferase (CCA-adding enzyme)
LRKGVVRIVRAHMIDPGRADPLRARRLLARHGASIAFDLLDHKEADLRGKRRRGEPVAEADLERLTRFREVVEQEVESPHRLRDLAISGDDLIAAGYQPGPPIGRALQSLLDEVVTDPQRNTRPALLERARELLA